VIGFFSAFNTIYMEFLAIWVLCNSKTNMVCLGSFVILMILIEFPNFVASAIHEDDLKVITTNAHGSGRIGKIMEIRYTTSSRAGPEEKTKTFDG
jgi:hypothetical protein